MCSSQYHNYAIFFYNPVALDGILFVMHLQIGCSILWRHESQWLNSVILENLILIFFFEWNVIILDCCSAFRGTTKGKAVSASVCSAQRAFFNTKFVRIKATTQSNPVHGVEKSMKNEKKMPGFGTHIFCLGIPDPRDHKNA